jgi:RHS repeat-associated protein
MFVDNVFPRAGLRRQSLPFLTLKERDVETGLDYFNARYYPSVQGRFSSADPLLASAEVGDPQTWNRYSYVSNKPLNRVDPSGMDDCTIEKPCVQVPESEWLTVGPVVNGGTVTVTDTATPISTTTDPVIFSTTITG